MGRTAPGASSWANMMTMHDDDAIAFHHAERRRLIPEALVVEAQLVAIIIGSRDHIGYGEKKLTVCVRSVLLLAEK